MSSNGTFKTFNNNFGCIYWLQFVLWMIRLYQNMMFDWTSNILEVHRKLVLKVAFFTSSVQMQFKERSKMSFR